MKKLGIAAIVGLLALVIGLPGTAGATATGASVFNCKVALPVWPTPNGPPVNCNGKITGVIEGKTTANKNYVLTPANAAFTAHANKYSETCTAGQALNGKADGTISVTGVKSVAPAGQATIVGIKFVWTRIGSTALINLSSGTILLPGGAVATGNKGTSVAAFVPQPIPPGTCAAPKPLNPTIAGITIFQN